MTDHLKSSLTSKYITVVCLNSIISLQIIDIELDIDGDERNRQCSVKIDLNRLINLKSLELDFHKDNCFELNSNSSNQLKQNKHNIKDMKPRKHFYPNSLSNCFSALARNLK